MLQQDNKELPPFDEGPAYSFFYALHSTGASHRYNQMCFRVVFGVIST